MGAIGDTRKLLQDIVTPDLKALDASVVGLEHRLDLKIEKLDQKIDLKYELLDKKIDSRHDSLDKKIDSKTELLMTEIRNLAAAVAANHSATMHMLDIDRRMEKIESTISKTN